MESFIERISSHNSTCYFHNLKFDGPFIMDFLFNQGFKHIVTKETVPPGNFTTLISDMGRYFTITVRWLNGHNTEFRCSTNKFPNMSIAKIAKSFGMDKLKGEIDYHAPRPVGYEPTEEENEYQRNDVIILAKALKIAFDGGMNKLTVASDAMGEYKSIMGTKLFSRMFPTLPLDMDSEIRRAYRGGWTYCSDRFKGRIVRSGKVYDVNSLYPSVMRLQRLPFGIPQWVPGKVEPTEDRPLTIFSITFTAKLKKDHLPCIQIKGSSIFQATEYLKEITEPTTLMVTNIDLALYQDHYDMDILEYGGGWAFHAVAGLFDRYIDKWSEIKINSTGGKKEIAKLHLNSLYGKFATNPVNGSKVPVMTDGIVDLKRGVSDTGKPVYTAMGVFITSYARDITIRAAQANYDTFAYADTDSLHLLQDDAPENLDIHPSRMGAWKLEYDFDSAFYVRPKFYLERHPEGIHFKDCAEDCQTVNHYTNAIAGVPTHVSGPLTFDDLIDGSVLHGKMIPVHVKGGIILQDIPYKLNLG